MSDQVMEGAEPQYMPGERTGILLLHDLGDTPQTMSKLAEAFAAEGCAVEIPLLPGHGTDVSQLGETTWDDWAGASQLVLDELASRAGPIVVAGIGLGATLACWAAVEHPSVAGVIAINPRAMPVPAEATEMLEAMLADGMDTVPPLGPDVSDRSAKVLSYGTVPVRTLISMFSALDHMSTHWDELKCPIMTITSARDHRVSPANAEWLAAHSSGVVDQVVLDHGFHLATLDVDHEALEQASLDFLRRVTS